MIYIVNQKNVLIALLTLVLCLSLGTAMANDNTIGILVNGQLISQEIPARLINETTMVPARLVSQALGAQVGWSDEYSTVIIRTSAFATSLPIDTPVNTTRGEATRLEINGQVIDKAPIAIIEGRTYVPLRLIGEHLGAGVDWDGTTNQVKLTTPTQPSVAANDPIMDLLLKTTTKQLAATSYSFAGTTQMKMALPLAEGAAPTAMDVEMDMTGAFVKPDEMYYKVAMAIAGLPEIDGVAMPPLPETEMYMKGSTVYTKLPTGQWMKMDLGASVDIGALTQIDPAVSIQMMQDADVALTKKDLTENGKQYHVVTAQMEGAKLYDAVKPMLDEFGITDQLGAEEKAEMDQMMEQMMKTLRAEYSCWINAATSETDRVTMNMSMTIEAEGISMPMEMTMDATYQYNTEVKMPVITPEMIIEMPTPDLPF